MHTHKQGFPSGTPHGLAIAAATEAAQRFVGDGEQVLAAEVMEQSPEHEEAGEFLVRVEIGPLTSPSS
uniref:hypothetical protein n=1 Tax=Herbidospora sakaeratensis TaxID=564415 RepID=UPI000783D7A4|nr:hypothetical protein [Herbidospora sakaeratensis]